MGSSTRLTFLLFLAITAATTKASWSSGDIRVGQPTLQPTARKARTPARQIPRLLAIRNVTIIPGTGAPPMENATVLIRGDRIAAIGSAAETVIPAGAQSIEGAGKFLLPGFIDMHAHLSKARASALGLFVANGVTTLRDMGGDHEELLRWRREVQSGARIGPRILMAGPILEAAHRVERMRKDPPEARIEPLERVRIPVGSPEEARRIVAELASREIDFLKIRTVQDRETYLALNKAANSHGIPLVGHVSGIPPEVALDAGQDGVDHNFYPSLEAKTREERLAVWRKFAARGEAGMDLLVGSDVAALNIFPGFSIHDEMALFVTELGMTPAEVIERATSRSAKFLRIADSVGTIERGKVADLALLDANPLQDIRNTRRIAAVILRGQLYDSGGLEQILAAVRAAPDRQVDDWGRKSTTRGRK